MEAIISFPLNSFEQEEDKGDVQILAIVPEFLIRAPFVIVRPLAIYPAAAVPPATAYHQLSSPLSPPHSSLG
jgi:hypothetical protein